MTDTAAANDDPTIVIHLNKLKGYLAAGVTGLLRVAGGVLIAHGFGNATMLNDYIGPASQEIAGWLLALGGQGWAWYRESHKNSKIVEAARDGTIVVQEGPLK